jgi:hypothetical protein
VRRLPAPGFPDRGWLLFFARFDDVGDLEIDDVPGNGAVRWFDAPPSALHEIPIPRRFRSGALIPKARLPHALTAQVVSPRIEQTLPVAEDLVWDMLGIKLTTAQGLRWGDVVEQICGDPPGIMVGGYAMPQQGDPRCDLVASDCEGLSDDERDVQMASLGLAWIQLAQVDVDDRCGTYLIKAGDLAARRFGRARLVVQFD